MTNIRSLIGKLDELTATVFTTKPDVICITETWLSEDIDTVSVSIPGYVMHRKDRDKRKGGGVVIFVRDDARCCLIPIQIVVRDDFELLAIEITNYNLILLCLYIPPSLSSPILRDIYDELVQEVDALLCQRPNRSLVTVGDFNHFRCDNLCNAFDLVDIVDNPTRGSNVLDHILVSRDLSEVYKKENVVFNAPVGNSDHLTLYAVPVTPLPEAVRSRVVTIYDFRESNLTSLRRSLSKVNWESHMDSTTDVNELCAIFNNILNIHIQASIPQNQVIMTRRDKEWLTPITKSLINERWEAYRMKDWQKYNKLKVKVKTEVHKSKTLFCEKMKQTTHGLWKLVKSWSGGNNFRNWNSLISVDRPEVLVSNIAHVLQKKYSCSDDSYVNQLSLEHDDWSFDIEEEMVYKLLKSLSWKKAVGIDNVPTRIYSEMADYLAKPLKIIFDASINQRTFPSLWKMAIICPIPKSNPPSTEKIRPISLLPVVSKLFEKIVLKKTWCKIVQHYGRSQHGFRPGHSTTTALIDLLESAFAQYDDISNHGVAIISFDLSGAFDCLDHATTIKKFCALQFPNGFIKWLYSYLKDRKYTVKVEGFFSELCSMTKGVPQGSVLGPSIFSVFTNDLHSVNSSTKMIKYADDINIVVPLQKNSDAKSDILTEISNIENWCKANKMTLNKDKSRVILCTRNKDLLNFELPLTTSSNMTVLGVVINDKLTWSHHITKIVKKCNRRFFILRKLKPYIDSEDLKLVYAALIRSVLEYASPCFVRLPKTLDHQLTRIERRAMKIIFPESVSHIEFSSELKERRETASKKLFLKIAHVQSHILHKNIPRRLQKTGHFNVKPTRTTKYQQSFFPYVTLLLNKYHLI